MSQPTVNTAPADLPVEAEAPKNSEEKKVDAVEPEGAAPSAEVTAENVDGNNAAPEVEKAENDEANDTVVSSTQEIPMESAPTSAEDDLKPADDSKASAETDAQTKGTCINQLKSLL